MSEANKKDLFSALAQNAHPEDVLETMQPFVDMMMRYECALLEVKTKLEVLDKSLSMRGSRNPFESIKCRVKKPLSIIEKMQRKGLDLTVENMEKELNDIAGVRVVCSFQDDIYELAQCLADQDDITVLKWKDYIREPKPNGYRSLHMVVQVPVFLADHRQEMRVEVQFRTIAMDFWASLDHKVKYKKNIQNPEKIAAELKECADAISVLDQRMQEIRYEINAAQDED